LLRPARVGDNDCIGGKKADVTDSRPPGHLPIISALSSQTQYLHSRQFERMKAQVAPTPGAEQHHFSDGTGLAGDAIPNLFFCRHEHSYHLIDQPT
jgi:hypothetical protein